MLLALPPLLVAAVEARPSKALKSPYVADVRIATEDSSIEKQKGLCHSPGLGCAGLVAPGRHILVSPATTLGAKTQWTARIAECEDSEGPFLIGIHPLDCQNAAAELLDGLLTREHGAARWSSEVCIDSHTRIDYVGTLVDNRKVYVEVKTAMISHQTDRPRASRRAVFPEGFRRSTADTVSPRAVKHCHTLSVLARRSDTAAAILLFVVPCSTEQGTRQLSPASQVKASLSLGPIAKPASTSIPRIVSTVLRFETPSPLVSRCGSSASSPPKPAWSFIENFPLSVPDAVEKTKRVC